MALSSQPGRRKAQLCVSTQGAAHPQAARAGSRETGGGQEPRKTRAAVQPEGFVSPLGLRRGHGARRSRGSGTPADGTGAPQQDGPPGGAR